MLTTAFDAALAGCGARLRRSDGSETALAVHRWGGDAGGEDGWLLDRCAGSVIDLGCGPGRLVAALRERGLPAMGVDVSVVAQQACRRRGVPMLRRDLFSVLPGEGRWQHVLLADGNIGIGGDPGRLLRRAAGLLRAGGTVLVETAELPERFWRGTARVLSGAGGETAVPWAEVGSAALTRLAGAAGLRAVARHTGARAFVELVAT
ncbi:class I SAM-dependent methyltransferase [Pseudonocardia sp. TRM90224]|uniref:class I SAM-dependent methyltransferase n=1 Tax=Pseudonocardia sp. TRM90224 TaxID=2812678 RepID=UPI001E2D592E|nr:methyltransferase domain-containing protein [Pseudonocardia sp. TRM90224]